MEFMCEVIQGSVSGKDVALFTLRVVKVALKIGGSLIPFPGNLLAAKMVDFGIHCLSKESAESLEDTIDRIATEAVGRALKVQALREAKIFVDASEQQIHFHESLDNCWAHLEGVSVGEYSTAKDLKSLFSAETAFNRWLIIENTLAASLHRLLPPERPDARTKKEGDKGKLEKVEDRAKFFTVIVDHFLLYLMVLSKMADKVEMESPEHELHDSVQERAREMAKLVLPNLAVMWEKQWDNPWMNMFYQKNLDYEHEVFHSKYRWEKGFAAQYWWKNNPRWNKQALAKVQNFNLKKRTKYGTLYENNTQVLATRLKGILNNKFLYPRELQQSKWCGRFTDTASFHRGARAAEFILKCLWHPLYDAALSCQAQEIYTWSDQRKDNFWWYFKKKPQKLEVSSCIALCCRMWELRLQRAGGVDPYDAYLDFVNHDETLVLECPLGQVILGLVLKGRHKNSLHHPQGELEAGVECGKVDGLHTINNTGYTFEASELGVNRPFFDVPCARDYAVLEKVELSHEQLKPTCRYAYYAKPECQKPSSE